jgi:hypothetical protein
VSRAKGRVLRAWITKWFLNCTRIHAIFITRIYLSWWVPIITEQQMVKLQKCLHFSAEARKLIKLNILFAPNTRLYVLHVNRAVAIRRGDGGVIAPPENQLSLYTPFCRQMQPPLSGCHIYTYKRSYNWSFLFCFSYPISNLFRHNCYKTTENKTRSFLWKYLQYKLKIVSICPFFCPLSTGTVFLSNYLSTTCSCSRWFRIM